MSTIKTATLALLSAMAACALFAGIMWLGVAALTWAMRVPPTASIPMLATAWVLGFGGFIGAIVGLVGMIAGPVTATIATLEAR